MQRLAHWQLTKLQVPVPAVPTTDLYSELQLRRGVRPPRGATQAGMFEAQAPSRARHRSFMINASRAAFVCLFKLKLRARWQQPLPQSRAG